VRLYLSAALTTGTIKPLWNEYAKHNSLEDAMRVFLAGGIGKPFVVKQHEPKCEIYLLESFFYIKEAEWLHKLIPTFRDFLLDSGAFTFMSNKAKTADWNRYVDEYADFINRHNIHHFFELDIDTLVGIAEVLRLRKRLEARTGKQPIPVWHRSRGKQAWLDLCNDYKYVAIGGIVTGEITKKDFPVFTWFLNEAEQRGARVHGLGFTGYNDLHRYKFYSVDSTGWVYGNRGGFLYRFNGRDLDKIDAPANRRMKSRETAIHNFNEWVKFMRYADKQL
jgi:hypothetical protein